MTFGIEYNIDKRKWGTRNGSKTFKAASILMKERNWQKDQPIVEVLPKGDLVYPLSQHIGAPATPVVAVGDKVLKGQKIAEAGGFVSSRSMRRHPVQ